MNLRVSDVSQANRVGVYKTLLRNVSLSRLELAKHLHISLPTVTKIVKSLIEAGLAADVGTKASTGGRKAVVTQTLKSARLALGVDITKNHIGFAVVNLGGEVLVHVRLPKIFSHSPDYYTDISNMALNFLSSHGLDTERILGTGLSMPGIVSGDGDVLLNSHVLSLSAPVVLSLPLLPQPCRLFNDATAACNAELWGQPEDASMVYLCLSNSVGGALVRHGRIISGDNERCAEIGHMTLDPHGPLCYCGQKGHYDTYGSALNLANYSQGSLENFFAALSSGNAGAEQIFNTYLSNLAQIVCSIRMLADADIVVGGYVGSHLNPYLQVIREKVACLDTFASQSSPLVPASYVRLCKHKFESSAVGAAQYHILTFIESV